MFDYCVRGLHMEEGVACNRIQVARAAREHPALLGALRAGDLHLTGIRLIAPHLTRENCADWIRAARHKSVREIRALIADRHPKPDVKATLRKQPVRTDASQARTRVEVPQPAVACEASPPAGAPASPARVSPAPGSPASRASRSEPLGGGRYSVKFTADETCAAALEELRSLLRHEIPDGDLTRILKRAVLELLVKVRKRKFAVLDGEPTAEAPKRVARREGPEEREETPANPPESKSRHIPNAIRRAIWQRDGGSCSFVARSGRRCGSRDFLEFDHLVPFARAPRHSVAGIALRCRAHNQAAARAVFGERHMDRFAGRTAGRSRASDPDQTSPVG